MNEALVHALIATNLALDLLLITGLCFGQKGKK